MVAQIEHPRSAPAGRQEFQRLKTQLHRQMVDAIDISKAGQLDAEETPTPAPARLAAHLCSLEPVLSLPHGEQGEGMVQEILDEIFAFGPLQPLMNDPAVSDVLVNGCRNVYVERDGLLEPTDVKFADDDHLLRFIQRLVRGAADGLSTKVSPPVDAKLPDGSRLNRRHSPAGLARPHAVDSLDSKPKRCCSRTWCGRKAWRPRWLTF